MRCSLMHAVRDCSALHLLRSTACRMKAHSRKRAPGAAREGRRGAHIDAGGVRVALHLQHGLHLEEVGLAGGRQDPGHRAHQQEHLVALPLVALRLRMHGGEGCISSTCTQQQPLWGAPLW